MGGCRLYLAEHHITLLGTNCFQWPKGVPYSFAKARETLMYTWRAVAAAQATKKMLWTVGYRGLNDYPFWLDDTSFKTPAGDSDSFVVRWESFRLVGLRLVGLHNRQRGAV
jgi:hypothetical protein